MASFWNSKTEIFCGLLSSRRVKSLGLETFDGLAGFGVFDGDVDNHQVGFGVNLTLVSGTRQRALLSVRRPCMASSTWPR